MSDYSDIDKLTQTTMSERTLKTLLISADFAMDTPATHRGRQLAEAIVRRAAAVADAWPGTEDVSLDAAAHGPGVAILRDAGLEEEK